MNMSYNHTERKGNFFFVSAIIKLTGYLSSGGSASSYTLVYTLVHETDHCMVGTELV